MASKQGWGHASKDSVDDAAAKQEARRNKGFQPLRFWLPNDEKAVKRKDNECEIIILDDWFVSDDPGEGAFMIREHTIKGPDGKFYQESCCADFDDCAVCASQGKEGYNVAFLTVLVLKEWKDKQGNTHEYSRMLLPIKMGAKDTFLELQQAAEKQGRTMRGMILRMKRGTDSKAVATGEPSMRDSGKLFGFVSEKTLRERFGHDAVTGRNGKTIKEEDEDITSYNYAELFPRPDPADLRKRYGGSSRPGSRESTRRFDDEDDEPKQTRRRRSLDEDDDIPMEHEGDKERRADDPDDEPPARQRRAPVDEDEDEPPARSRKPPVRDDADEELPARTRKGGSRDDGPTDDGW